MIGRRHRRLAPEGQIRDADGAVLAVARVFRLPGGVKRDQLIDEWIADEPEELAAIARHWFDVIRGCGDDVRELLHDGHPTACVGDAAFAYVDAFTAHVNIGFFNGAGLADPAGLLEGSGKHMRHVKLKPGDDTQAAAVAKLIEAAYAGTRLHAEAS
jgi:hypothetical protein